VFAQKTNQKTNTEMNLIDGKSIATAVKAEIANEVKKMIDADEKTPHLAAILIGNDPASETYIASKERSCKEIGFTSSV
jgi:methylenetetrahydrofolate dehydrogenase (NADP+)/methenyltetrahydrofolate cyclohydrolase